MYAMSMKEVFSAAQHDGWFSRARTGLALRVLGAMRSHFYPHSIMRAMIVVLCVLLIPLVVATVTATVGLERLTLQNQRAIIHATAVVRYGHQLLGELGDMERAAGIYEILGDTKFFESYRHSRELFQATLRKLKQQPLAGAQLGQLGQLDAAERALSAQLDGPPLSPDGEQALVAELQQMRRMAQDVLTQSSRSVEAKLARMQERSAHTRRVLLWEAAAVIPAVALVCLLVIVMIVRPLRRIEGKIRELGNGDFDGPLTVYGPRDIERLGERLEWLRSRLSELENEKQTFLQHVSHELKTPLASVREGASLLSDGVVGQLNAQQSEVTTIISRSTQQLQKRIEDLLDFSAAQSRDTALQIVAVSLSWLVEELVAQYTLVTDGRRVRIETRLVPITIEADREKVSIVLDNLLSNAVKYAPPESTIVVSVSHDRDWAQMDVLDQGPGIGPQDRERIFEPFYRGTGIGAETESVGGSGLGLSIAREYVRAHGGSIDVVGSDRGAHLRIRLPIHSTWLSVASKRGSARV
ncbi:MAG: HAMP domain-containing histidine kinase [Nevskiaceae bacterium]|nr:MAG: HAMP domain-containing histidine kinase [Nevskiaceae bacterium]TBR71857.1 MAG: HAMP domain-containing histidine kinase [Nevskiaceae bacterium]